LSSPLNDVTALTADGQPVYVVVKQIVVGPQAANGLSINLSQPVDGVQPVFPARDASIGLIPSGSQLLLAGGSLEANQAANAGAAAAGAVSLATPRVDLAVVSSVALGSEAAKNILPAGSIGVLFLQLPFEFNPEGRAKIEESPKFFTARGAAVPRAGSR